jgi:TolB-like protein
VAVLPLENLSSDPGYAYFAEAMSSEISTALARVPVLAVKSYESARRFEAADMTPRDFAAELGVAHLLEGGVQREEDRLRITVRLVDARTGEQVWSETYDREGVLEAIDIQMDIARRVAEELATELSAQEEDRIVAGSTDDPVAYDAFLQAGQYDPTVPEELDLAIDRLRRALGRDSTYAAAWASLGGRYEWKMRMTGEARWRDSTLLAFRRAAAHARDTPLENNLRAVVALLEGRGDEAASLMLEDAIANPGSSLATRDLGGTYVFMGAYDEGIRWIGRYLEFDPLDHVMWASLGELYSKLGLDPHAESAFRRAKEVGGSANRISWYPYAVHFQHAIRVGDLAGARELADSVRARRGAADPLAEGFLAISEGDFERAREALSSRSEDEVRLLPHLAFVQLGLGDSVAARNTLEAARDRPALLGGGDRGFPALAAAAVMGDPEEAAAALAEYTKQGGRDARWIRRDPLFDRVRDDPAFEAAFADLEEILARQRRQVERQLAEDK